MFSVITYFLAGRYGADVDPYAVEGGVGAMAKQLPRINVARLYQVLKG